MVANRIRVSYQNGYTVIKLPNRPGANDAVLHDEVAAIVLAFAGEYVLSTKEFVEGGLCVIEVGGGGKQESEKLKTRLAQSFDIIGNGTVNSVEDGEEEVSPKTRPIGKVRWSADYP